MVDWNSPAVLMASNQVFNSISHLAIGAYLWEAFSSIGFEWSIITGRRAFKWPMLLYFYCKWMLVAAFTGMIIALNVHTPINCQALYNFNQFAGNSTLGAASTLLMLRSIAIWQRNRWIVLFFLVVGGGLWGIQMHGVTTVRATWGHEQNTCNVDGVTGTYLTLVYLYTMFTDLTVLIVTLAGLNWSPGKSGLWRMLWDQGIAFFLIAFVANLIPAVMLLVNLNPVVNIMFSIPAIAATATCACRCFVGLSEYARRGDEMSAALATNASGGWSHRIQGPMKGTKGTIQFKRQDNRSGGPDFGGYSPTAPMGGDRFGSIAHHHGREVGPTDTIDHIMRSMSMSGPPGQRFDGGRRESDIRLDEFAITPGGGSGDTSGSGGSSVKYKGRAGSDDTLSFSPLDVTPRTAVGSPMGFHDIVADDFDQPHRGTTAVISVAAPVIRRTTSQQYHTSRPTSPPHQQQQMSERRPSAPQIIVPSADASRRPSAVSIDLAQASSRYTRQPRSPDENV